MAPFVGLTGGSGAGKSEALAAPGRAGGGDALDRRRGPRAARGRRAARALVARLGPDVAPDGAARSRADRRARVRRRGGPAWLEGVLWPRVGRARGRLARLPWPADRVAVVEAPLLFESGMEAVFDRTIAVIAEEDTRERARRRARPRRRGRARRAAALAAGKGERADFTVRNDGTLDELKQTLSRVLAKLDGSELTRTPASLGALAGAGARPAPPRSRGWSRRLPCSPRRSPRSRRRRPARRRGARDHAPAAPRGHHPPAGADKNVDPALIAAVIYEESRFRDQTSHAGARGLMQITPETADFIARRSGGVRFEQTDLATPQINIAYGAWYLRYLIDHYDGNETLAVAAYNAGQRQRRPLGRARGRAGQLRQRTPHPVPRDARLRQERAWSVAASTATTTGASSGSREPLARSPRSRIGWPSLARGTRTLSPRLSGRRRRRRRSRASDRTERVRRASAQAAQPARRQVRRGRAVGDPDARRRHSLDALSDVEGHGTVELEVARDRGFHKVAARGLIRTSPGPELLGQVAGGEPAPLRGVLLPLHHARVREPDRPLPHGAPTRLAPAGAVRLLVVPGLHVRATSTPTACSPRRTSTSSSTWATTSTPRPTTRPTTGSAGVRTDPIGFSETLEQYRAKYALYRTDPALRHMHSLFPMISIWDDHEVEDNYAGGAGPTGGLAPELRYSRRARPPPTARSSTACPPTAPRARQQPDLPRHALRQDRRPGGCSTSASTGPTSPAATPGRPACADLDAPRNFLGRRQMNSSRSDCPSSQAAWKVIANQVMVMPTIYPGGDYIGFDSWQGYPRERARAAAAPAPQEGRGRGVRHRRHPHVRGR